MQAFSEERQKRAEEVVKRVKLPSQPAIVIEINQELGLEAPDFKKIAELVSQDVAISAKVINVVNSPFFGLSRKVESIVQALTLMGLQNFYNVILTTCLQEALGADDEDGKVFWGHSIRTAVAARHIAQSLGATLLADEITPDQAYITGLFHDCGVPIMVQKDSKYEKISAFSISHRRDIIVAEDKYFDTDHCIIGQMMARSWSLSENIHKTILHHHSSDFLSDPDIPIKLVSILQLADYIAYSYDFSVGAVDHIINSEWEIEEWAESREQILDELVLSVEDIQEYKSELFEQFALE